MMHPLKEYRRRRRVTLDVAALALGVTKSNLSRIENGHQGLSDGLKHKILIWTGGSVTPNDLVAFMAAQDRGGEAA